jgi:hypothetical protein
LTPTGPLKVTAPRIGIMHRSRQHRRGGGFVRVGLEPDAKLGHQILGIGQNVHQVADRRALIAADIAHAGFQQRLGDGKDALAGEGLPGPSFRSSTSALKLRSATMPWLRSRACGY